MRGINEVRRPPTAEEVEAAHYYQRMVERLVEMAMYEGTYEMSSADPAQAHGLFVHGNGYEVQVWGDASLGRIDIGFPHKLENMKLAIANARRDPARYEGHQPEYGKTIQVTPETNFIGRIEESSGIYNPTVGACIYRRPGFILRPRLEEIDFTLLDSLQPVPVLPTTQLWQSEQIPERVVIPVGHTEPAGTPVG